MLVIGVNIARTSHNGKHHMKTLGQSRAIIDMKLSYVFVKLSLLASSVYEAAVRRPRTAGQNVVSRLRYPAFFYC